MLLREKGFKALPSYIHLRKDKGFNLASNFPASINIGNDNREGITNVLFQTDPNLTDSIARAFYDSHIEMENKIPTIKPNSRFYVCPACHEVYDKELFAGYNLCDGTAATPHKRTITEPKDWHPPLTDAGFNWLLGALERDLSSNLATGNYGEMKAGNVATAKEKLKLEKELMSNAHKMASFKINTLLGNVSQYVNPEFYMPPRKVSNLFSYSFVYEFIMGMTRNIYSVLSKGKGLAAVNAIATNRLVYEEHNEHEMGYSSKRQQEEEGQDLFSKLFGKVHNL